MDASGRGEADAETNTRIRGTSCREEVF